MADEMGARVATSDLVIRRPSWVAHVLDDEADEPRAVLLHLPSAERKALSSTATRVWQLIVAGGQVGVRTGDLVPILAAEYSADPTMIMRDVVALVDQMLAGEWVESVSGRPEGVAADSGWTISTDDGLTGGVAE